MTVNTVKESVEAELNDAFIAANTDSATVDEYRKAVREELEEALQMNADNQKKAEVFLKVVDASEVNVSEEAVTAYYEQQYSTYEQQAQMYGMDMETMVGYMGMDLESFETEMKEMSREGCIVRTSHIISFFLTKSAKIHLLFSSLLIHCPFTQYLQFVNSHDFTFISTFLLYILFVMFGCQFHNFIFSSVDY